MMRRPVQVIAAGGRRSRDSLEHCFLAHHYVHLGNGNGVPAEESIAGVYGIGYTLRLTHYIKNLESNYELLPDTLR
jgi:hypothetical protein